MVPIPASLFTDGNLRLRVWFDDGAHGIQQLSPDHPLTSVPYALAIADGAVTSNKIAPGTITADKLATGVAVPPGTIVMWSGATANIPRGWQLCDGNNGTPDLRDQFIQSIAAGEEAGGSGGANTHAISVSEMPAHNHGGSLTTSTTGSHTHTLNNYGQQALISVTANCGVAPPMSGGNCWYNWGNLNYAGDHSHTVTVQTQGSGSSFDVRPKYYKLAFIMKLAY